MERGVVMNTPSLEPNSRKLDDNFPPKVRKRFYFLINLAYFAVILTIVLVAVRYLFLWMLPFVLAFALATMLQTPLTWLVEKTKVSKKFFSVVLVVLFILLIASLVAVIGWQVIVTVINYVSDAGNIERIQNMVLAIFANLTSLLKNLSDYLPDDMLAPIQESIASMGSSIAQTLSAFFTNATGAVVTFTTTSFPMLLVSFIIWVVASIFLTIDYRKVTGFVMRQIPERYTEMVHTVRDLFTNTIFKLLRAYILLMLLTFAELSISFHILKVPYAFLIAALVALVDILPVLGTGTVLIPWSIISLIMGNPRMFIGIGLTYILITVIRNVLEPRLVSHQIGLNPLITLFFMFLGLRAIGIFGMLLFPVIVMILVQLQDSGKIRIWK